MSDPRDEPAGDVGSVGEEAAKLLGALSEWAREQGGDPGPATHANGAATGAATGAAGGVAGSFAEALRGLDQHVATGGEDCRWCPVCQVIHAVRQTSPEVRAHLTTAATSLVQAAAGLLATHTDGRRPGGPAGPGGVEKIDLDDETSWEEDA